MAKLTLPFTVVNATNPGQDAAVTVAEGTVSLAPGVYKIAAEGTSLKWKIGAVAVTAADGSLLVAGDQEIIKIPGNVGGATVPLRFIRSQSATADGFINITKAEIYELPVRDPSKVNLT